jgi:hypothetical protein
VEGGGPRPLGGGGAVVGVGLYKVSRRVVGTRAAAAELPGSSLWRTDGGTADVCASQRGPAQPHPTLLSEWNTEAEASGIQEWRQPEFRDGGR